MKKLVQHIRTGKMELIDVPPPEIKPGFILVRTLYSAISIGTELGLVNLLKSNIIQKARKKPEAVRKVFEMAKRYGIKTTRELIKTTIDRYMPIGYSLSGEVMVADEESEFRKGEIVACGGSEYASHQEIALIPRNLCVKVPPDVSPKIASFATIGSIAVWGLREAEAVFGERGLVVGLGLIGSMTALLGDFAGIQMFGVDTNPAKVKRARKLNVKSELPKDLIEDDFDFVVVAAGSGDAGPLEYALSKVRKRGRIVVIGALPINVDRDTMYHKEVRLSVSRSYGPGRYDPYYEILGYRYPKEHVRWDVKENMKVFLDFARKKGEVFEKIITREFNFEDAINAYEEIRKGNVTGAVFKYKMDSIDTNLYRTFENSVKKVPQKGALNIGIIGAGTFISSFILPHLVKENVNLKIVCNERPESAYNVSRRFSFEKYTTSTEEVIKEHPDLVIVGTRHNLHGSITKQLLDAGISVYVEKPLSIYPEDLFDIAKLLEKHREAMLYVGFNRRFAPFMRKIRNLLDRDSPMTGIVRVNAGSLDKKHWAKIREIGGDRIVGEVCHFIDVAVYLSRSRVRSVFAKSIPERSDFDDNVHIILKMENGSLFTIVYTEWGSKNLSKEYYEIHQGTKSFLLNDFKELHIFENGKRKKLKSAPDKGHKEAVKAVIKAMRTKMVPIPYEEIFNVSYTPFAIRESLRRGEEIIIREF